MSTTIHILHPVIAGKARGRLLFSRERLSFWGGVDSHTGEVIDRRHPLSGQILRGTILVFPGSRGSSSGSGVLLEAIRNGTAPAAIITLASDPILALAGLLAGELYGRSVPMATGGPEFFERAETAQAMLCELSEDGRLSIEA